MVSFVLFFSLKFVFRTLIVNQTLGPQSSSSSLPPYPGSAEHHVWNSSQTGALAAAVLQGDVKELGRVKKTTPKQHDVNLIKTKSYISTYFLSISTLGSPSNVIYTVKIYQDSNFLTLIHLCSFFDNIRTPVLDRRYLEVLLLRIWELGLRGTSRSIKRPKTIQQERGQDASRMVKL